MPYAFFFLIFFQGRFQIDAFSMISIKTRSLLVWLEGLNASKCMRFVCTGPNICFICAAIWLSGCAVMRGPKYLVKISNPLADVHYLGYSQPAKRLRLVCDSRKLKAYVKYSQILNPGLTSAMNFSCSPNSSVSEREEAQ